MSEREMHCLHKGKISDCPECMAILYPAPTSDWHDYWQSMPNEEFRQKLQEGVNSGDELPNARDYYNEKTQT